MTVYSFDVWLSVSRIIEVSLSEWKLAVKLCFEFTINYNHLVFWKFKSNSFTLAMENKHKPEGILRQ